MPISSTRLERRYQPRGADGESLRQRQLQADRREHRQLGRPRRFAGSGRRVGSGLAGRRAWRPAGGRDPSDPSGGVGAGRVVAGPSGGVGDSGPRRHTLRPGSDFTGRGSDPTARFGPHWTRLGPHGRLGGTLDLIGYGNREPRPPLFLAAVVLLVLGPRRLPEVARSLGKGIRELRDAMSEEIGRRRRRLQFPARLQSRPRTRSRPAAAIADTPSRAVDPT